MDRDDFFDSLRSETGGHDEALRFHRQLAYEERVIKRVVSDCGLKLSSWGRFANHCRQTTARDKLNFEWFNQTFRRFPGNLCGKRIPYLQDITIAELFRASKQNKLLKRLSKAAREFDIDITASSFVFVFPIVRTPFCAHSITNLKAAERLSLRITWEDEAAGMTIEPLAGFCRAIGHEWFEL